MLATWVYASAAMNTSGELGSTKIVYVPASMDTAMFQGPRLSWFCYCCGSAKEPQLACSSLQVLLRSSSRFMRRSRPGEAACLSTAGAAVGHWYPQALPKPSLDLNRLDAQMSESFSQLGSGSMASAVPPCSRILQILDVLSQRQQDPPGFAAGLQALAVRTYFAAKS
jgi:hypothetical protein